MSITTLDGVIAGMDPPVDVYKTLTATVAGRFLSGWLATGTPGAPSAPAPGIQGYGLKYGEAGASGAFYWTNPGSGNTYLARAALESTQLGTILLCDRLWHNSGNSSTSTSAQTHTLSISGISIANPTVVTVAAHGQAAGTTFTVHITGSNSTPTIDGTYTATYASATTFTIPVNVTGSGSAGTCYIAIPARDANGTTNGVGVGLGYEVSTVMGAGTPTLTATYVNSAGTAGQVTPSITLATTLPANSFIPLPLAAGDVGIRAIATHTKNATQTSGTYHLVMYRVITRIPITIINVGGVVDAVTGGFPRLYDNSSLFLLFLPQTTTAPNISGQIIYTQG